MAIPSKIIVFLLLGTLVFYSSSCKKTDVSPNNPIQGLWIGTYTVSATDPTYVGQSFFFSFSIYPDGTLTYKGKTPGNDVYAYGTWTLTGTAFTFKVTTLNYDGGYQHIQSGTATYNSTNGTLSDGAFVDSVTGGKSTWTMNRVN